MTGQTIPEEARKAGAKALLDEGGGPGNSYHSWRCEHPDRYGPCSCVEEVVDLILTAAAPFLLAEMTRIAAVNGGLYRSAEEELTLLRGLLAVPATTPDVQR